MNSKEQEVLNFINEKIREGKGTRVTPDSVIKDANLDSFGYVVLFSELDDKYNYFGVVPVGSDPFENIDWENLTYHEVIKQCI